MRYLKYVLLILLVGFALIFFFQNVAALSQSISIKIDLYKWQWNSPDVPFYVLTIAGFVIGALLTVVFFVVDRIRLGCQVKEQRTKAARLEQENADLLAQLDAAKAASYSSAKPSAVVTETVVTPDPDAPNATA